MGDRPLIHVIDDDDAVREALQFLLETEDMEVSAWSSAQAFLSGAGPRGDCVITDVRMPDKSGMDLLREMKALGSPLPIIMITGHGDVPLAVEALKAGVADFIEKPFDDHTILRVVRSTLADASRVRDKVLERGQARQRLALLSPREHQVMRGIVAGSLNKTIAYDLGISPRTVEVYRANVMSKMGADSLSELVRMVILAED